mmetsp:Transcript_22811/g.65790  ORF Transcript_22811/g.65790 Transcript_22811/m.65790 type:complete len:205 (-) Transcript_22811:1520-2134(-)
MFRRFVATLQRAALVQLHGLGADFRVGRQPSELPGGPAGGDACPPHREDAGGHRTDQEGSFVEREFAAAHPPDARAHRAACEGVVGERVEGRAGHHAGGGLERRRLVHRRARRGGARRQRALQGRELRRHRLFGARGTHRRQARCCGHVDDPQGGPRPHVRRDLHALLRPSFCDGHRRRGCRSLGRRPRELPDGPGAGGERRGP